MLVFSSLEFRTLQPVLNVLTSKRRFSSSLGNHATVVQLVQLAVYLYLIQSPTKEGDQLSIGNCLVHSPVLKSCHVEHPCVEALQTLPNCGPNSYFLLRSSSL